MLQFRRRLSFVLRRPCGVPVAAARPWWQSRGHVRTRKQTIVARAASRSAPSWHPCSCARVHACVCVRVFFILSPSRRGVHKERPNRTLALASASAMTLPGCHHPTYSSPHRRLWRLLLWGRALEPCELLDPESGSGPPVPVPALSAVPGVGCGNAWSLAAAWAPAATASASGICCSAAFLFLSFGLSGGAPLAFLYLYLNIQSEHQWTAA